MLERLLGLAAVGQLDPHPPASSTVHLRSVRHFTVGFHSTHSRESVLASLVLSSGRYGLLGLSPPNWWPCWSHQAAARARRWLRQPWAALRAAARDSCPRKTRGPHGGLNAQDLRRLSLGSAQARAHHRNPHPPHRL